MYNRLWYVAIYKTLCQVFEWEIALLSRHGFRFLQSEARVSWKAIFILRLPLIDGFVYIVVFSKEEGSLRNMNAEKLLKTLPVLQAQLDGLLEFDCQSNDLTNGMYNFLYLDINP